MRDTTAGRYFLIVRYFIRDDRYTLKSDRNCWCVKCEVSTVTLVDRVIFGNFTFPSRIHGKASNSFLDRCLVYMSTLWSIIEEDNVSNVFDNCKELRMLPYSVERFCGFQIWFFFLRLRSFWLNKFDIYQLPNRISTSCLISRQTNWSTDWLINTVID